MNSSTKYKMEHKSDFGKEKIDILYEDSSLMIIYKPNGILTVPYPGSHSKTCIDKIEEIMRKRGTYSKNHRPFVVHRLDRETSGVMMFAMTEDAQKKIMDNWQTLVKERLYVAVAENPVNDEKVLPDKGLIDDEIAYNAHNIGFVPNASSHPINTAENRKAASKKTTQTKENSSIFERNLTVKNGQVEFKTIPAKTNYKIIARGKTHTLFELSLDTGRKNQIRAHLSSKGYILAGDENYRAHTDPFHRLALHAKNLEFVHPYTNETMKFEIPEPENWLKFVETNKIKCEIPVWSKNFQPSNKNKRIHENYKNNGITQNKHKKLSKLDFIQQGKLKQNR